MHRLNIKSDIRLPIPSYFRVRKLKNIDLSIEVGEPSTRNMELVAPPYLFFKNKRIVHKYGFPVPCSISIENLEGNTKVKFTPLYNKLPNINVDEIINYIIDLKLFQKGVLRVHGACVEYKNDGIMVVGWDGSGKSTIAFNFMKMGASFLTDDTTLIDGNYAYSYPKKIKIFKGVRGLTETLDKIPYVNKCIMSHKRVTPRNIIDKTKIKYVFVSRYGESGIRKVSKEQMFKTMMVLNIYTTRRRDIKNLVLAYCYYNKYDLGGLLQKRTDIIKKLLKNTKCYEVFSKTPREAMELIKRTIAK